MPGAQIPKDSKNKNIDGSAFSSKVSEEIGMAHYVVAITSAPVETETNTPNAGNDREKAVIDTQLTVVVRPELGVTQPVLLDQNPAAVYLATLRPTGRRAQQAALNIMAQMLSGDAKQTAFTLPWQNLRYQHTAALVAALQEGQGYRPATINRYIAALKGVLKQAWNLGLLPSEDYQRAVNIKSVRGSTLLRGRALRRGELSDLLEACATDKIKQPVTARRDAAIIAVLYGAGLRRSEVVKLNVEDYDLENGGLTVRGGKGGKDRLCYVGAGAENVLTEWLKIRGTEDGPLFYAVVKGDKLNRKGGAMTDQAVLYILQKRAKQAGVKPFSPHDLRRTFISDLLDAGADIATVQKLAGHADVSTTARYDRRGEVAKRKAASLLQIPSPAANKSYSD